MTQNTWVMSDRGRYYRNPVIGGVLSFDDRDRDWFIKFDDEDPPELVIEVDTLDDKLSRKHVKGILSAIEVVADISGDLTCGQLRCFSKPGKDLKECMQPSVSCFLSIHMPPPDAYFQKSVGEAVFNKAFIKRPQKGRLWTFGAEIVPDKARVLEASDQECSTLVVLQNAWAKDPPRWDWSYEDWVTFLMWSKTGKRLSLMLGEDMRGVVFTNTTPFICVGNGTIKPMDGYVRKQIERFAPDLVIACGLQAYGQVKSLSCDSVLEIPHPAARFLTDNDPVFYAVAEVLQQRPWKGVVSVSKDRKTGKPLIVGLEQELTLADD